MINETKIKFCGLTNYDEVAFAYEKKIFWIGFIFVRGSPRFIEFGKTKEIQAEGLLATCIQHEIDHLEGILFIDYLSKLKKSMIVKKLSKQKKELERIVV